MPKIARVVVDVALNREFDYLVPDRLLLDLRVGSRVMVPFGRREARGYITAFSDSSTFSKLKEIHEVVGKKAMFDETILKLARWVADYYVAPVEKAVSTVVPGAVRRAGAGFKERMMVFPSAALQDPAVVEAVRKKAPKQARVLDVLLGEGQMFLQHLVRDAGVSAATIRGLERKKLVTVGREAQAREPLSAQTILPTQPLALMPQQSDALALIRRSMDTLLPSVVLLYGVTGSGKTEVYLQAIQYARSRGQGAIVLVPEIALTPQTIERFRGRFGNDIAVLHSGLSDGERHDEWHRVRDGAARIVVGARSALFAPVSNLGLIVVDEEHEPTYKQEEAPRYNARDVAVMRGQMEKCAVVLGSATPALESFHNAQRGKYGMARMMHRVDHRQMPAVRVIDMRVEASREGGRHVLSRDLLLAIQTRLDRAEQTMLFLNRRGYSTSLVCPKCGYVATCNRCSVSMTYHKREDKLVCHICGAVRDVPRRCPNEKCRDPAFRYSGIGTQRVESAVAKLFPHARIRRMDSDTTNRKDAHHRILGEFRTGKIDILIGTQMIAKGLHFPNVTLVGVVFADLSLHVPDFRAAERTFQLLTQVAGRAGRGDVMGEVLVQTYTPHHPAIQAARRLDYDGFYDQEIEFRKALQYPPCGHLVCLTIRGAHEEKTALTADVFMKALQPELPPSVMAGGPAPAPLARAKGQYRFQIMLRASATKTITEPLKKILMTFKWPDGIHYAVDVDALSLL